MLTRTCLAVQRLLLSAWVGAAILFVVTSVAEQKFAGFTGGTKNQLALIRFPRYYVFGFAALAISLLCSIIRLLAGERDRRTQAVFGLLLVAAALIVLDYVLVYSPLADLMTDLHRPRDEVFQRYHQMSKYVNAAGLLLAGAAAVIACRTRPDDSRVNAPDAAPDGGS